MGELLWDMFPSGKQLGGAPVNFAYHAMQFGLKSMAISAVGKDPLGDEILGLLDSKGMDCRVHRVDYPTGTVRVTLKAAGVPDFQIEQHVAWDNIPAGDDLTEIASRTSIFCFGTLAQRSPVSRTSILHFIDNMPDGDERLKIFDINLRQFFYDRTVIEESLKRCNALKINDEEYMILAKMFHLPESDRKQGAHRLMSDYELRMVILTCGAEGSYIYLPDNTSYLPTPKVQVCDTVGAGDSFTAAFCAAWTCGKSIAEAHRIAVEVAAYVCTCPGSMPELPERFNNML